MFKGDEIELLTTNFHELSWRLELLDICNQFHESEEISILNEKVLLTKGCINIENVYQATQSEDSKGLYMTSDDNNMWIQRANAMSDLIDSKYFVLNEIDTPCELTI